MEDKRTNKRARQNNVPALLLIGGMLVILGGLVWLGGQNQASASRSGSAVDFTVADLAGQNVRLSDYRGHPVYVNLWASWCPPCRSEMPALIRFYNAHKDEGLIFLAVDTQDQADPAKQFAQQLQMPFPVLYDPNGQVAHIWGVNSFPTSFLIGPDGTVRFMRTGAVTPELLDSQVLPLIRQ